MNLWLHLKNKNKQFATVLFFTFNKLLFRKVKMAHAF